MHSGKCHDKRVAKPPKKADVRCEKGGGSGHWWGTSSHATKGGPAEGGGAPENATTPLGEDCSLAMQL